MDVPKGMLRLAALKLLSGSSMSGTDLADHISRITDGEWKPGPGSVYLILKDLLKRGLITELPRREGNVRRYIISSKGKEELSRLVRTVNDDVGRQLKLLSVYSTLAGSDGLAKALLSNAERAND